MTRKLKAMASAAVKKVSTSTPKVAAETKKVSAAKRAVASKKELTVDTGNAFVNAVGEETLLDTRTLNGMKAMSTTTDANVDLFAAIGAMRGKDILPMFRKAYDENQELALRIALWARDARSGAGERKIFRDILEYITKTATRLTQRGKNVLLKVPELGRFDDLLYTKGKSREFAIGIIAAALEEKNGLCAKWMPRQGKVANELRTAFGLTPKEWRKLLVSLTNVVETAMCEQNWSKIEFGKIPSVAFSRYTKAFKKHTPEKFDKFMTKVEAGEDKINAGAIYPYQVIQSLNRGNIREAEAQWKALPNYVGAASVLPVIDTSGSMTCSAGGNSNVTCLDVSLSLGLYLADKNKGVFKDVVVEFGSHPKLIKLTGSLADKYRTAYYNSDCMSTDIEKVINLVLKTALQNRVPQADMPKTLLLISDMQFNQGAHCDWSSLQMIKSKYAAAGYEMPNVVYWNVNDYGNRPAKANEKGVALVSGFSPAIMTSIMQGKDFSPLGIMLETVMKERYNI